MSKVNQECDAIPKCRIEMLGSRGVSLWLDGQYISRGIRKVEFIADGSKNSPVLNISMDVGEFKFEHDRDLIEKQQ